MRRFLILALLFTIVGCTTTQQAMDRANNAYTGHNIDELVLRLGSPCGNHQLNNEQQVYTWSLGNHTYNMPSTTSSSGYVDRWGHYNGSSYTSGGDAINIGCDIQVITTGDGTIIGITALRDTWGAWTTSRCAEIFK